MIRSFNHGNHIAFSSRTLAAIGWPSSEDDALEVAHSLSTVFAARASEWRSRGGLGTMTSSFRRALDLVGSGQKITSTDLAVSQIGSMAARLDGARALLEHAGKILDIAQVTPKRDTIHNASRATLAADIVVAEAAAEIEALLRDLTKTAPSHGNKTQTDANPWRGSGEIVTDHYNQLGALHPTKGTALWAERANGNQISATFSGS